MMSSPTAAPEGELAALQQQLQRLERRLERERNARKQAEHLLEGKSLELYNRNQELTRLHDSLEQEVKQRTRELEIARDKALEANRAKTNFLANVSHELRTPLTAVIGFAENIKNGIIAIDEVDSAIESIIDSSYHLLGVLNGIINISDIESGTLTKELATVPIKRLFELIRSNFGAEAANKGLNFDLTIHPSVPERIVTDPVMFKQILFHITQNAVKFTQQGKVSLAVNHHPASRLLEVKVEDSGIGISPADTPRLFRPFTQLDEESNRQYGGNGMGLHLSKRLANLLGGDITVNSTKGEGSVFTITIDSGDMNSIDKREPKSKVIPIIPKLQGKVLVADDSPVNLQIVTTLLKACQLEIVTATNGEEAVEAALSDNFNLVLMDIQMPKMDGKQAFELLQQLGFSTPVIALTANVMPEDMTNYQQQGFYSCLAKPIEQEKFFATLAQTIPAAAATAPASEALPIEAWMVELRGQFINELRSLKQQLQQARERNDTTGCTKIAHRIKGSAGNVGFHRLTDEAGELQSRLKSQRLEELVLQLDQFSDHIDQLLAEHSHD